MASVETFPAEIGSKVSKTIGNTKLLVPILGVGIILGTVILALSIATLVKVDKKFDEIVENDKKLTISSKALQPSSDSILTGSIYIEEVMSHLRQLQRIATR